MKWQAQHAIRSKLVGGDCNDPIASMMYWFYLHATASHATRRIFHYYHFMLIADTTLQVQNKLVSEKYRNL